MIIKESFLPINIFSRSGKILSGVKFLVIHYTNNPRQSAKGCHEYFTLLENQKESPETKYASAHYIIGLNGEILQCMPEKEVAYHVGSTALDPNSCKIYTDIKRGLCGEANPNYNSIGIEVCHSDSTGKFNQVSKESLILLARDIVLRYKLTKNQVVRHYDIVGWKKCPKYYVDNNNEWYSLIDDIFTGVV
jgi:N-acetylmuramoyl-L-alanine amidase